MEIKVKTNQLEVIEGLSSEYPYVMHYSEMDKIKVPWHWHEELEFDYVESGSVEVHTTNQRYTFHSGEAFFINTNILCTMKASGSNEPCIMYSHLFHPIFLGGHFKSIFETKYLEPVMKNKRIEVIELKGDNDRQQEILSKLKKVSYLQQKENSEFETRNLFSEIWVLLLAKIEELEKNSISVKLANQERIQTMMSFIQQHYQEKITLEAIALSAAVSKRECLRCFRSCIKRTPFEYLSEYRIEVATKLLRTTDDSIVNIALQVGFSNSAYFCKVFKQMYNMPPNAYRKNSWA